MKSIEAMVRAGSPGGEFLCDQMDVRERGVATRVLTVLTVWCIIPVAIPIAVVAATVKTIYNVTVGSILAAGVVVAINFGDRES